MTARVAWSGTGINLRTNRAKPEDVAKAVRKVLVDPSYQQHAQRIGKAIEGSRGLDALLDLLEDAARADHQAVGCSDEQVIRSTCSPINGCPSGSRARMEYLSQLSSPTFP
ncbi:hypothetical protein GC088_03265 [Arthrobacter sp. JZ12]|nr:hypothetical protein GC088_03265 [Arthrobacter sp. JZ12]